MKRVKCAEFGVNICTYSIFIMPDSLYDICIRIRLVALQLVSQLNDCAKWSQHIHLYVYSFPTNTYIYIHIQSKVNLTSNNYYMAMLLKRPISCATSR